MKITSSGIGTVATAQGFNGASAKPYQWAWDASKETSPLGGVGLGSDNVFASVSSVTLEKVPDGIKCTPINDNELFFDFRDGKSSSVSGQLNAVDTPRAKYMHGIFDFSSAGATTIATVNGLIANKDYLGGAQGRGKLDFYWLKPDDQANYAGSSAIRAFGTLSKTILVWDMNHPDTNPGIYPDNGASGSDWSTGDFTGEEPFRIEFLSQETTTDNPFYLFGYILANRILSPEEISLPVDISKARS
jgi:hypothetical protein